jgi:hypothetical protein
VQERYIEGGSMSDVKSSNPMASPGELIVALRSGLGRANMGEQAFDWIIVYLMRYTELMRRLGLPSDAELPVETTTPQAPIAKVTVRESGAGHYAPDDVSITLYAPGLPPGEHDLFCEPESIAPYSRAKAPAVHWIPNETLTLTVAEVRALGTVLLYLQNDYGDNHPAACFAMLLAAYRRLTPPPCSAAEPREISGNVIGAGIPPDGAPSMPEHSPEEPTPSRERQLSAALGQWLHDFGSTNELCQRTRILLGIPHPAPEKATAAQCPHYWHEYSNRCRLPEGHDGDHAFPGVDGRLPDTGY